MPTPAITLEALPVAHGDSLLLSCPVGKRTWRMLIDTGPEACWPLLQARLRALPVDLQGRRHLDRLVITHIDHDHIGAVQRLLSDASLSLTVGDVWFNAPPRPAARAVEEGQSTGWGAQRTKSSLALEPGVQRPTRSDRGGWCGNGTAGCSR